MSKYRLGDFGTIMKGKKDFCQYDEPYKMISELNKLERQLAEAREALVKSNSQLDLTWYAIGSSTDIYTKDKIKTIYKNELDKLKEKGDE